MTDNEKLNEFLSGIHEDIESYVDDSEEITWEDRYTEVLIDYLTEAGEIDDGEVCGYVRKGIKVNGYSYGAEDIDRLDLFVTSCKKTIPAASISKNEISSEIRKVQTFLEKSLQHAYFNIIPDFSPVFDLAMLLHERRDNFKHIKIYLFSDCRTKPISLQDSEINGTRISFHVWDIERVFRLASSGTQRETIEIDFKERFGQTIPCLKVDGSASSYDTCFALFPGDVLASIYEDFGARLLERNVRSFLQARGKVNKGIRDTLKTQPQMFLAFNNGITGTADQIKFENGKNGQQGIRYIRDFQIVNGGQTTASLLHSKKNDKTDLATVFVQAKICTISDSKKVDEIVPLISRYSNSQNKVNEADFYANDPFHLEIEELSRTVWAPAAHGSNLQTRWFYERSRGQYNDAKSKLTPAQKRKFNQENPTRQKFTKTDLAKFENTWMQLPDKVSLGAQKNFREFTARLAERRGFKADQSYFEKLVAKAIMFKSTEKIVSSQNYGGYRANIVTYTLAWLSFLTAQRIDLVKIWKTQEFSESLSESIRKLSKTVYEHIITPPSTIKNVTEWCKKEKCWNELRQKEVNIKLSSLKDDLISSRGKQEPIDRGIAGPDEKDREIIKYIEEIDSDKWFEMARWGKETENLQTWQRGIAFSIGKLLARGKKPSRKQAIQGKKIIEDATRFGFKISDGSGQSG